MTWRLGFPHPGPLSTGEGGNRRVMFTKREGCFLFTDAGCFLQEWLISHDASIACVSWSGNRAIAAAASEAAMAESPKMLMEKEGPLGWITFNQPEKRNAVSQEMWQMIPDIVKDVEEDEESRVIVLRGAGDQPFVAGADIS